MNIYQLSLFASLNPSPPCFVIPVFTTSNSNRTFVQNLFPSGRIDRFMTFDTDSFVAVPATAPIFDRRPGEDGVMAFWLEEDVVLCGTSDLLKELLGNTGSIADSPFVEVERATFLEDGGLIELAAIAASKLLNGKSARLTYLERVKGRVKLLASLRDEQVALDDENDNDLESLILELQHHADNETWVNIWSAGWRNYTWRSRLYDVARWRVMSLGLGDSEYPVLRYVNFYLSSDPQDLSRWWLSNRSFNQPAWALVWKLAGAGAEEYPAEHVIKSLNLAFENRAYRREQWPLLNAWNTAYQLYDSNRRELEVIAENSDGRDFYKDYFIEYIIHPIIVQSPGNGWAIKKLSEWFETPSGVSNWIRMFLLFGKKVLTEKQFLRSSLLWLRKYGRGTNSWIELYGRVSDGLTIDEAWQIRVMWLRNARKDLYSWPDVFESLADDAGPENFAELSEIARSWVFQGRSRRDNATIDEFAKR